MGVRGIFENRQAVGTGDGGDCVHIGHGSPKMNGDDGARFGSYGFANAVGVDIKSIRFDIDEDWRCSHPRHSGRGRDEGNGRHDDLVALTDSKRFERHLDGDSAVARAETETALLEGCEFLFEASDEGMIAAPAVAGEHFIEKFALARAGNRP